MNKIKTIFIISLIIIVSVIAAIYYIQKPRPIPPITQTPTASTAHSTLKPTADLVTGPKTDLAFAVLGDVHDSTDNFQRAINDLYTINPAMDALVLNGDTVNQGLENQYDSVKKTLNLNKDLLPKTIIKNIGNHEFFDYSVNENSPQQVKTFINRYLEFSGEQKVYHDTWVKGYHFISLGTEECKTKRTGSTAAYISETQQNWLKEKLSENYQKGKPIFVFLHQNLMVTEWGWVGVIQSEQVRNILSKYPEVILFTSHTHIEFNNGSIVSNQPFTMVHTGAVAYTLLFENGVINMDRKPYIRGLYIEVNGNSVVVKGRNLKGKQWIFSKEISK